MGAAKINARSLDTKPAKKKMGVCVFLFLSSHEWQILKVEIAVAAGFSAPPNLGLFPLLGRKRPKREVIRVARCTKKSCSVCTNPSFKGGRQKSGEKCALAIKSPLMAKNTQKNTLLSETNKGPKKAMRGKPQSLAQITLIISKKALGGKKK